MILYLASDLIWATKIKSMGEDIGVPCRPVRNIDMLNARLADTPDIKGLVLDLESPDVAMAMLAIIRDPANFETTRNIRIIAFAPHVKRDIMQAAQDAGAHQVLPRGAFDHDMADILLKLEGRTNLHT